ncbi:MAG: hypothetical protein FRX48_07744 [Lasallia pustulata]|uniref:Uncharacterized protein n=2 Tax=Lasallia pustulata TaxID=136370 RepID=A0A5M8PJ84_9LECA|nr:MAG: hypothetical protein FRX48_07744 [Lasallia pustulata]
MAPDLNSLPPSRSPSDAATQPRNFGNPELLRRETPSPSPRSSSVSLAAAATINAGIQNQDSRRSSTSNRGSPIVGRNERRRSNVMMSLNFNDPSLPGPGELQGNDHRSSIGHSYRTASPHSIGGSPTIATGDPHHQRTPSLGEIHQELEQEQEAQVNRLLQMIRQQQAQLQQIQQMQQSAGFTPSSSTAAVDDSTPTSERSFSFPPVPATLPMSVINPRPRSPVPRASFDLSRQSSRRSRNSSRTGSPAMRPESVGLQAHGDEWLLPGPSQGSRDESAFFQAETQTLTRENQMLRLRIRELERQFNEMNSAQANTPAVPSNLVNPPVEADSAGTAAEGQPGDEENKR